MQYFYNHELQWLLLRHSNFCISEEKNLNYKVNQKLPPIPPKSLFNEELFVQKNIKTIGLRLKRRFARIKQLLNYEIFGVMQEIL